MMSKKQLPHDLILLGQYERGILNEVIYPFLEEHNIVSNDLYNAPSFFNKIHGVVVTKIANINDNNFDGVISIRCYHKFDSDYIQHFNTTNKFIWNLHPGNLPNYRGVMTCIRAMNNNENMHTYTLHLMDENWDAGPVIKKLPIQLDTTVSMLESMCNLYPTGALILNECINDFYNNNYIITKVQYNHEYYSFPTHEDIRSYQTKGLKLYDHNFMLQFYINNFLPIDSDYRDSLQISISTYLAGRV
jgi:hypothetical protein